MQHVPKSLGVAISLRTGALAFIISGCFWVINGHKTLEKQIKNNFDL